MLLSTIAAILIVLGLVFFTGGTLGLLRMPDFCSRLHPAGKLDSLGVLCCLVGLALFNLNDFTWTKLVVSVKMCLVVMFIYLTSPTATHAMMDSGIRAGMRWWQKPRTENESDE